MQSTGNNARGQTDLKVSDAFLTALSSPDLPRSDVSCSILVTFSFRASATKAVCPVRTILLTIYKSVGSLDFMDNSTDSEVGLSDRMDIR
jgi:hypothetical protein